jgi:pSer/pThr/pTyr-binding forkhead associated (FHA) protein
VGTAPTTTIGRERTPGGIVLHDPNVSRRHAELSYDGRVWRIRDLDSTNGTLVNDVDVDTCVLRDGDLLTLGLLNLEFRES